MSVEILQALELGAPPLESPEQKFVWVFASALKALIAFRRIPSLREMPASLLHSKLTVKAGPGAIATLASALAGEPRTGFDPSMTVGQLVDALQSWSRPRAIPVHALIAALLPPGDSLHMPHHASDGAAYVDGVTAAVQLLYSVARPLTPADSAWADKAFEGLWHADLLAFLNAHLPHRWGVPLRADELLRLCRAASQPEASVPAVVTVALSSGAPCDVALGQALEDTPEMFYAAFGFPMRKPKTAPPLPPFTVDLCAVVLRAEEALVRGGLGAGSPTGGSSSIAPAPAANAAATYRLQQQQQQNLLQASQASAVPAPYSTPGFPPASGPSLASPPLLQPSYPVTSSGLPPPLPAPVSSIPLRQAPVPGGAAIVPPKQPLPPAAPALQKGPPQPLSPPSSPLVGGSASFQVRDA
jgi:hypothetical protein